MRQFIATLLKPITIDGVEHKKGERITLQESQEFSPAYWIVVDGVVTRDLLTNEYGNMFELVREISQAA